MLKYNPETDTLYVSFYDEEKKKQVSLIISEVSKKSEYFPEDDILWVDISEKKSFESEHIFDGNFVVDFDKNGDPVGLEIFGWKRFYDERCVGKQEKK
ncbi:MAG: DUF2283 domain-containing protein [Desulfurobacteriaceae bacterium]